ncbi:uncharacterized protein LOC119964156 [Scyliorhinus canicula]|uniref:uncharacterized protein LOC119964156 n=1 Tax=Scyliorhinus canicula TaxID=7830 RepID=UPI0018F34A7C|nr:uncharacterized protein LOC119964156 [Scyliorhinus canicula]
MQPLRSVRNCGDFSGGYSALMCPVNGEAAVRPFGCAKDPVDFHSYQKPILKQTRKIQSLFSLGIRGDFSGGSGALLGPVNDSIEKTNKGVNEMKLPASQPRHPVSASRLGKLPSQFNLHPGVEKPLTENFRKSRREIAPTPTIQEQGKYLAKTPTYELPPQRKINLSPTFPRESPEHAPRTGCWYKIRSSPTTCRMSAGHFSAWGAEDGQVLYYMQKVTRDDQSVRPTFTPTPSQTAFKLPQTFQRFSRKYVNVKKENATSLEVIQNDKNNFASSNTQSSDRHNAIPAIWALFHKLFTYNWTSSTDR